MTLTLPIARPMLSGCMSAMDRRPPLTCRSLPPLHQQFRTLIADHVTKDQWQMQKKLYKVHETGPIKPRKRKHPLDEACQMKGIVIKPIIKKPKKPNSANRKCVMVRLTNGRIMPAYIPGIGHNLQEHSLVIVEKRRTKDVPGLKLKCIRGMLDLAHVIRKTQTPQ